MGQDVTNQLNGIGTGPGNMGPANQVPVTNVHPMDQVLPQGDMGPAFGGMGKTQNAPAAPGPAVTGTSGPSGNVNNMIAQLLMKLKGGR